MQRKGFDPNSQEVARQLDLPLYELSSEPMTRTIRRFGIDLFTQEICWTKYIIETEYKPSIDNEVTNKGETDSWEAEVVFSRRYSPNLLHEPSTKSQGGNTNNLGDEFPVI
jgi:hypothetical protein